MACRLTAVVMFTIVMSSVALVSKEVMHTRELLRERIQISKTADEAEQKCLSGDTVGAMKIIALSYRPGGMKMTQEEGRRLLNACFAQQDVLGEGIFCKLGSQDQCDWASACVEEGRCDSPPLGEALAQLKATTTVVEVSASQGQQGNPPSGWSCSNAWYDADDGCDCNCGGYDPDCADAYHHIYGCQQHEGCDPITFSCRQGLETFRYEEEECESSGYNTLAGNFGGSAGELTFGMEFAWYSDGERPESQEDDRTWGSDGGYDYYGNWTFDGGFDYYGDGTGVGGSNYYGDGTGDGTGEGGSLDSFGGGNGGSVFQSLLQKRQLNAEREWCLLCDGGDMTGSIRIKILNGYGEEIGSHGTLQFEVVGNSPPAVAFSKQFEWDKLHRIALSYSRASKSVRLVERSFDFATETESTKAVYTKTFSSAQNAIIRNPCLGSWRAQGNTGETSKNFPGDIHGYTMEESLLCYNSGDCRYSLEGLKCETVTFNSIIDGLCVFGAPEGDKHDECSDNNDCDGASTCVHMEHSVQESGTTYGWNACVECEYDTDCWGHAFRHVCDSATKQCVWPNGWSSEDVGDDDGQGGLIGKVDDDWQTIGSNFGVCPEGTHLSVETGQCDTTTVAEQNAFAPRDSLGNIIPKGFGEQSGKRSGKERIKGKGPKVHQWEGKFPRVKPDHVNANLDDIKNQLEGAGSGVWTSNQLANFAITASQIAVKGGAENHMQKEDWLWDKVVPWILAK